uniref:Uncharacterized protein n=1 Tax=Prymnesium polylepis TaxID=72548 RepID=A0A7S4NL77_9EUKA|mmetsp:Transcript_8542/g.20467  ORF Transcript_8542/g.20467 Transcript_8542/m.20467 type:complete len:150 (+) Transcript_8542:67-516(+)
MSHCPNTWVRHGHKNTSDHHIPTMAQRTHVNMIHPNPPSICPHASNKDRKVRTCHPHDGLASRDVPPARHGRASGIPSLQLTWACSRAGPKDSAVAARQCISAALLLHAIGGLKRPSVRSRAPLGVCRGRVEGVARRLLVRAAAQLPAD